MATRLIFLSLILIQLSVSANSLQEFHATYDAFRNGKKLGDAQMRLTHLKDQQYQLFYQSDVSIFFLSDKREETSVFRLGEDNDFIPISYRYKRTGTGKDKSLALEFDSDKKQIILEKGDPIIWNDELDNQLYRFDFQSSLKNKAEKLQYNIINYRGQLREYGFEILGEEVLDLPYGKIKAIKVKTIRENKKRETFSWFAPELDYVMVRLQQFKSGKEQGDVKLAKYTLEPISTDTSN